MRTAQPCHPQFPGLTEVVNFRLHRYLSLTVSGRFQPQTEKLAGAPRRQGLTAPRETLTVRCRFDSSGRAQFFASTRPEGAQPPRGLTALPWGQAIRLPSRLSYGVQPGQRWGVGLTRPRRNPNTAFIRSVEASAIRPRPLLSIAGVRGNRRLHAKPVRRLGWANPAAFRNCLESFPTYDFFVGAPFDDQVHSLF
jgi:hypothetical protein